MAMVCMCVLICMMSVTALAGDAEEGYGYSHLENEIQRELYVGIRDGVAKWENPISFYVSDPGFTGDDLQLAVDMVNADYPEYFWFDCGLNVSIHYDGLVEMTAAYFVDGQAVSSAEDEYAALLNEVEDILDDMPESADTDYEKALYLHDALAEHVTYVFTDNDQTAYGALVDGQAVCAGYARAYQLLLKAAGLDAWTVVGTSLDPGGNPVGHAWNLLWIEDDCCYADVTWDDQGDTLFHAFFGQSLEMFDRTHAPNAMYEDKLPLCQHEAHDYFTIETGAGTGVGGYVTDSIAADDILDCVKAYQSEGYAYTTVSIMYNGSDLDSWLDDYINCVYREYEMNGCSCYLAAVGDEYQIKIVSGTGGVYTVTKDGQINLELSYLDSGLSEGDTYDLMVAYYTTEGQFIGTEVVQAVVDGVVSVTVDCPKAFGSCKVLVPDGETYVPLCRAISVLRK